jgi:inosine-uridine nucleoside N-ribohydrolase
MECYNDTMKTVSLTIPKSDYEALQKAAEAESRSVTDVFREAVAFYREHKSKAKTPLHDLPVFAGHQPLLPLPSRSELYDEVLEVRS